MTNHQRRKDSSVKKTLLILVICAPLLGQSGPDSLDYYHEGRLVAEREYSPVLTVLGGAIAEAFGGLIGVGVGALIIYIVEPTVPARHSREMSPYQRRDFEDGYRAVVKEERIKGYLGGATVVAITELLLIAVLISADY